MKYQEPSFTVPVSGREPYDCKHGWKDAKSRCVFCGERVKVVFVPRHKWCSICHKRSMLNLDGVEYCGFHANRAVLNETTMSKRAKQIAAEAGPKEIEVAETTE